MSTHVVLLPGHEDTWEAASPERLTGLHVVGTDDLPDLLEVCALLADVESGVEARAAVRS